MDIAERVASILLSANTMKINIIFDGVNGHKVVVLPPDFINVAVFIKLGYIQVKLGNADPGTGIYTAKDDGMLKANTFYFGQNDYSSKSFEALVVHESVHAAYDIKKATLPWMDSEVAAYIAQGYYATNAGVPDGNVSLKEYVGLGKRIANDLIAGQPIDDLVMSDLRDKLKADPTYAGYINTNFVGDGVV